MRRRRLGREGRSNAPFRTPVLIHGIKIWLHNNNVRESDLIRELVAGIAGIFSALALFSLVVSYQVGPSSNGITSIASYRPLPSPFTLSGENQRLYFPGFEGVSSAILPVLVMVLGASLLGFLASRLAQERLEE